MCRAGLVQLDFIFGCRVSSGHPFHCRSSSVLLDLFLRMSSGCFTVFFDCLLFRRSSIQVPTRHGAVGLHLRLSRLPAITHPTADRARCGLAFFFGGCLTVFLRLSPLQAVTHPCADPAWSCWSSSSAVAFPAVTHPTADRAWCGLAFFFDCLLFRWSAI